MNGLACFTMLMCSLGLLACQSPNSAIQAKTHEYTLKQKCPTLMNMKVGEVLLFSAPENPSTGYQWQLLQPLKIFKTEETYLQNGAGDGAVGVGGTKTFRFTAEKPGQDFIHLVHIRPWESTKQPDQQWQCRIRVS